MACDSNFTDGRQLSPVMEMSPVHERTKDRQSQENGFDIEAFRQAAPIYSDRDSSASEKASKERRDEATKLAKAVVAEFIATALYLCTGITTVIDTDAKVFPVAVGHAMLIFLIVSAFGPVR